MAVTTQLTWMQEKSLQNCLGGKQFTLLYKASVHGFSSENLLEKCSNQGPTVTVIYGEDYVIGAYMQGSYYRDNKASVTFFAFQRTEISEFEIRIFNTRTDNNKIKERRFGSGEIYYGYHDLQINLNDRNVTMDRTTSKKFALHKSHISFQECEVFRCEDSLDKRRIEDVTLLRKSLFSDMRTYNPCGGLVHQTRILLLGPSGAGKSSFINSVKSVFRGHVTNQAVVDFGTKQFRTYSIKDGETGNSLQFVLCDSMGLGEKKEGLCTDDIFYILKGHVPDRYQFNSIKPITSSHLNYIDSPWLKDRIHCVVFVLDVNSVENLSHEMVAKIKRAQRDVIKCGVVHMALLTHVDDLHLIMKADLINPYGCMPVKLKLEEVHRKLGFPLSNILVVSNYTSEWELNLIKDVLILSTLRQILWAADDFLEDVPAEETFGGSEA
ncbi:interferon-induced protein 44 [Orycteropus afer afer]|uniref:Interferon-induced protein 44 n=1 Tax=Orycteropus afer afer TaxID=1230840 RepID=A0AC54ZBF5_ORYAF|nr:interferon-induced protein 44 [Orycteropus afer afer]